MATKRVAHTATQRKNLVALASTVGLRMLGLLLLMSVFTLYGLQFTPSRFLVGFAFGCYGLTMAVLQIPLGRLSDRIERRKVLLLGMTLFSLGSFLMSASVSGFLLMLTALKDKPALPWRPSDVAARSPLQ